MRRPSLPVNRRRVSCCSRSLQWTGRRKCHPTNPPLHETEIALIRQWIQQGAENDSPPESERIFTSENPPVYHGQPTLTSLDLSPDGSLLAVAGYHEILIYSMPDQSLVHRLVGMSERIQSVRFSPDGQRLAAAGGNPGRNGEIQIWDPAQATLEMSGSFTLDTLYGVSWSPDNRLVAFGAADKAVRAIEARSGKLVVFQGSHDDWVLDTSFSNDGAFIISVGRDMTAKLTEVATQRFIDNITSITPGALKGGIHAVEAHPSGNYMIFGGADGVPKIYRYERVTKREIGDDANQLLELPPMAGRIFDVKVNADGSRVAAASSSNNTGYVTLFDVSNDLEPQENIKKILTKPTHTRSRGELDALSQYFQSKARILAEVSIPQTPLYTLDLSADGATAIAGGKNGTIFVIETVSGKISSQFRVGPDVPVGTQDPVISGASLSDSWILPHERPEDLNFLTLPNGVVVKSLEVEPRQINISQPGGYNQIVVDAITPAGLRWDVTRMVHYELKDPIAELTRTGFMKPLSDGQSVLTISLGSISMDIPVSISGQAQKLEPDWSLHVNPVISRLGCNAGTCHGSKDGKNGFKLSLRGYDPVMDMLSLTDDLGSRRVNFADPTRSLMLLKSSSEIPHEGGQLVNRSHDYYHILEQWILNGGKVTSSPENKVRKLTIHPQNPVVEKEGHAQQMRVIAEYPNGQMRDVTREAFLESGNPEVAEKIKGWPGLVRASRRGEAPVLVRFEGAYASTILTVMGDRTGFVWEDPPFNNTIDTLVAEKWKRLKILPSGLSDDYTFVRRLYLDLIGLPPTPDQLDAFIQSSLPAEEKRNILIDELLHSEAFVDHWSNKWADLLQVNGKFLGREGSEIFRQWIHDAIASNTPYDMFVSQIVTATGSNRENPPASYFKVLRDAESLMENTTHLFLATRFNCNKCHDHPFERWTQDQYYEMAAFFAQTTLKADPESKDRRIGGSAVESAQPLFEIVEDAQLGEIKHQRTSAITPPDFPFPVAAIKPTSGDSRREALAQWLTSSDNPYFASSYVNRLWGYLLGTGIIEPLDDIRAGNPPSNPKLLDFLTREFIDHQFDTRHIIRLICQSRTYQLSVESHPWNEDDHTNFSHAKARRLPAEVLYDTIHTVLQTTPRIPGVAPGTRAAELPDSAIRLNDGFLGNFGRPVRESACECERSSDLQLGPVMALISGPTVGQAISDPENILSQLIHGSNQPDAWIDGIFRHILNRPASQPEIQATLQMLDAPKIEHQQLVAQLNEYSQQIQSERDKLDQERLARIAAAQTALDQFQNDWVIKKAQLTDQRIKTAESLENDLIQLKESIRSGLNEAAAGLGDVTRWSSPHILGASTTSADVLVSAPGNGFLVAGPNGKSTYELFLTPNPHGTISGVRLDTLPHPDLPKNGPGRAGGDGNFVLTEISAEYFAPVSKAPEEQPIQKVWSLAQDGPQSDWQPHGNASWKKMENGLWSILSNGVDPMMEVEVDAPPGWIRVECLMEVSTDKPAATQLFFSDAEKHQYSEAKSRKLALHPSAGPVQNASFLIWAEQPLRSLRFDPASEAGQTTIYQISLTHIGTTSSQTLKFSKAVADFSQGNFDVSKAINGNTGDNDGWAISPQIGSQHTALFQLAEPQTLDPKGFLKISLVQNYNSNIHSIGHFKIQTTSSPEADKFGVPAEIGQIIAVAPDRRSVDQTEKLLNFLTHQNAGYQQLTKQIQDARQPVPDDPKLAELSMAVESAKLPVPPDPFLEQLKRDVRLSAQQLENPRLTVAQDLAWALINSPAFLFNH
ncbi:MAG: DUF1549 domain-containing protein [Verrucomicrobia bacterium]|nr:DUF1549 domain-containing protein [Verrucomicrobiota bacterium]